MGKINMDEDTKKIMDFIQPIVPHIPEIINIYYKDREKEIPLYRLKYWMHLTIMIFIISSISFLAYCKIIDGSATVGIIGTMVGYVFGKLYSKN